MTPEQLQKAAHRASVASQRAAKEKTERIEKEKRNARPTDLPVQAHNNGRILGCSADEAIALHKYKPPLHRRFFYALCRHGWVLFVVALAVLVLSGCSDMDSEERGAANLRDAVAQAQALPNTVTEVK